MTEQVEKLIEGLRNELQQYGEMLALLDQQQLLVSRNGGAKIVQSISEINAQSALIQEARDARQRVQRALAEKLGQPAEATFSQLLPLLPAAYCPLVSALVQENNELLHRVRERAQENQGLLRRSVELMQRFITTLSPESSPGTPDQPPVVLTVEPASALYAAII